MEKEKKNKLHRAVNTIVGVINMGIGIVLVLIVLEQEASNQIKYNELKHSIECNSDSIFKVISEADTWGSINVK